MFLFPPHIILFYIQYHFIDNKYKLLLSHNKNKRLNILMSTPIAKPFNGFEGRFKTNYKLLEDHMMRLYKFGYIYLFIFLVIFGYMFQLFVYAQDRYFG